MSLLLGYHWGGSAKSKDADRPAGFPNSREKESSADSQGNDRLEIERQKLDLEKQKFELEKERFEFEKLKQQEQ